MTCQKCGLPDDTCICNGKFNIEKLNTSPPVVVIDKDRTRITLPSPPSLPEHEKYNHDYNLLIEEFLDFLGSKKIQLCVPDEKMDCFFPTRQTRMELIFEFLGVDLKAWEKENQALLEYMRRLNDIDKLNEGNK